MDTKHILLADDNVNDVELTLTALGKANIVNPVDVVGDGVEALDYLLRRGKYAGRPDVNPVVVLLDIKMPRMTGLEVLEVIRKDPKLAMLPVVMLTSSRQEADLLSSYKNGANAFVVKPGEFADFSNAIRQLGIFWVLINETPPAV